MPSMMVKPEFMEFLEPNVKKLIAKAEAKGEKITKEEATNLAFENLLRAGVHRQSATRNYLKNHPKVKKERKPRAPKKAATPKAKKEAKPKKAKAPKAAKKERPAAPAEQPKTEPAQAAPANGGEGMLE